MFAKIKMFIILVTRIRKLNISIISLIVRLKLELNKFLYWFIANRDMFADVFKFSEENTYIFSFLRVKRTYNICFEFKL